MTKKDFLFDIIKDEVKLNSFLAALPANMLAKYAGYNKAVTVKKTVEAEDVFFTVFPEYKSQETFLDSILVFKDPSYSGRTVIEASFHIERGGKMIEITKIEDNEKLLTLSDIFQEV